MKSIIESVMYLFLAVFIFSSTVNGEEILFTKKPVAKKKGDLIIIDFSVNNYTDVAVYIEDTKGKILRHLVAGKLGEKAPLPLQKNSLKQSIEWDRKDDIGRILPEGKYQIRVGLGLQVKYAGMMFSKQKGPNNLTGGVIGLSCGKDGRVYVINNMGLWLYWNTRKIQVYLRDGSYEKTIAPFHANLSPKQLPTSRAFTNEDGYLNPIVHRVLGVDFLPYAGAGRQIVVTPNNQLVFPAVPANRNDYWRGKMVHMAVMDTTGNIPGSLYANPLTGKGVKFSDPYFTLTSNNESVYLSGLSSGPNKIYLAGIKKREPAQLFYDNKSKIRGLATDGAGHLLIADWAKDRILILDEKSKAEVGTIAIKKPKWVEIHKKSGALYVNSGNEIIKYSGWKDAKEVFRMALPPRGKDKRFRWSFALDAYATPTTLWLGRSMGRGDKLSRLVEEEDGKKFGEPKRAGYYTPPKFWNISSDPTHTKIAFQMGGEFSSKLYIFDEKTKELKRAPAKGHQGRTFALSSNGNIIAYDHWWKDGVHQYGSNGKQLPFLKADKHMFPKKNSGKLPTRGDGLTAWARGMCVDRHGNIYVKFRRSKANWTTVEKFGPDGESKGSVIRQVAAGRGIIGPRVDAKGNIYIGDAVKPVAYPKLFKDHVRPDKFGQVWYDYLYGSLVKFGPEGGGIWKPRRNKKKKWADGVPPADPILDTLKKSSVGKTNMRGVEWWHFGFAPLNDMKNRGDQFCQCTGTSFDVDDFGRSFFPNQGLFRMEILDTGGNPLLKFGGYGNQDYLGSDSYVVDPQKKHLRPRIKSDPKELVSPFAKPEIAFGWIVGVAVTDHNIYIIDGLNNRVMRCKLKYTSEETCAMP